MGMSLDCGGHLSHGSPVNISGKYFHIVPYGVTAEGFIDYDEVLRRIEQLKPAHLICDVRISEVSESETNINYVIVSSVCEHSSTIISEV